MATPTYNRKSPTIKRILREASELSSSPPTTYHAAPLDTNLFEWHFTLLGPPDTPYARGIYHGRITLPAAYPLRPPSFRFLTPSGRFEVNREICLSISGHHEDTWQPAWGVRTAVVALRAFMEQEASGQVGGVECSDDVRRQLAEQSRAWRCDGCGGRRNDEVLTGEEDARPDREVVPEELKLAYRGEGKVEGGGAQASGSGDGASGVMADAVEAAPVVESVADAPLLEGPANTTPPAPVPPPQGVVVQLRADEEENFWIDRAIWGLAIVLVAIIVKRFFGVTVT